MSEDFYSDIEHDVLDYSLVFSVENDILRHQIKRLFFDKNINVNVGTGLSDSKRLVLEYSPDIELVDVTDVISDFQKDITVTLEIYWIVESFSLFDHVPHKLMNFIYEIDAEIYFVIYDDDQESWSDDES